MDTELYWLKIQNAGLKAELKYWKLRYFLQYKFWGM